jgi:hypothetical protein
MSNNVSSFISDLKDLANKETISITVPSTNKAVKFKPLSVRQQKDALKASLTGVQGTLLFFNTINNILEENCEEPIEFTIQDRVYITLQLRNNALGSSYIKGGKTYDLATSFVEIPKLPNLDIEYKGISVKLSIPTLKADTAINQKCAQEIKNKQAEEIADVVDILYVYEIIKYIESIEFNDEIIEFSNLSLKNKKDVVDVLPLALNKELLSAITKIKSYDDNYLSIQGDDLTLDVSLLTGD